MCGFYHEVILTALGSRQSQNTNVMCSFYIIMTFAGAAGSVAVALLLIARPTGAT